MWGNIHGPSSVWYRRQSLNASHSRHPRAISRVVPLNTTAVWDAHYSSPIYQLAPNHAVDQSMIDGAAGFKSCVWHCIQLKKLSKRHITCQWKPTFAATHTTRLKCLGNLVRTTIVTVTYQRSVGKELKNIESEFGYILQYGL